MDIAFLNRMLGLTRGGGEIWDLQVGTALDEGGFDVTFYVGRPLFGTVDTIDGRDTVAVPTPHLLDVAYAAPRGIGGMLADLDISLFARLASRRVGSQHDVVHVTGYPKLGAVVDRLDAPVVITLHARPHSFWHDTVLPFRSSYDWLSRFDAITAVGTTAETVREETGLEVTRIDPGVDTERFAPASSLNDGPTTLLFVGRFVPAKNLELLLEAFAELNEQNPETRLLLVGDGPLRDEIEATAERLGVTNSVSFEGYVDHSSVHEYYRQADCFVMSSRSENYPIVLLEAMSCGLPVVAPKIGSIPELVTDGETGLLFESGSRTGLVDCLETVTGNADLREHLGRTAREVVEDSHSWEARADQLATVFERL